MNAHAPAAGFVIPTPVRPKGRGGLRLVTGSCDPDKGRPEVEGALDHLHETGAETVDHLLANYDFRGPVWMPACGRGAIARPFQKAGYFVVASDIADYGFGTPGIDFLACETARGPNIVENPPFGNSGGEKFFAHGMRLLKKVRPSSRTTRRLVLLHRFGFLETPARDTIFECPEFQGAIVMARTRQPMMHREGYRGKKLKKSPVLFAWFVWDLDRPRPPGVDPWMKRV
ncbi:hypothetical protein sos41_11650 [Alphaproteobacteria bacterium SO-S41]|nr:hypothetical protein sos41_11650 [Alphaproteobacteria bacterium SO-S41]